ncbi:MAG: glycosyl transferase family 1 [Flavobacteriales bacterium]|nr:glycosyl transferase family 1 [Flavobacteriales bacterium]
MSEKKKLLFIYPQLYTFVKTDLELLSDKFQIISFNQKWSSKYLLPFNLIVQFFYLLFNIVKVDKILISFGGYHSLLPALFGKIFNKKIFIIVHGTDCVSFPEINYGNLRNPIMRFFISNTYNLVDKILPVSKSLVYTKNTYYSKTPIEFGYSYHLKDIATPYKVIHNAVDHSFWCKDKKTLKDNNTFISVLSNGKEHIKGIDLLCEVTSSFPNCNFFLAGIDKIDSLKIPNNVICLGRLNPKQLREYYSKSRFYLQLSNTEGFGVSLCEAMLCECIPIVSSVNMLPEIVGDTGFILERRDSSMLSRLINDAISCNFDLLSKRARLKIKDNYFKQKRKSSLIKELTSK